MQQAPRNAHFSLSLLHLSRILCSLQSKSNRNRTMSSAQGLVDVHDGHTARSVRPALPLGETRRQSCTSKGQSHVTHLARSSHNSQFVGLASAVVARHSLYSFLWNSRSRVRERAIQHDRSRKHHRRLRTRHCARQRAGVLWRIHSATSQGAQQTSVRRGCGRRSSRT